MYKLHSPKLPSVSSLKVKKPSKRVVLAGLVTLVVLCAVVGSLAVYQQHKQAEHDQAVAAAQKQAQADKARRVAVQATADKLQQVEADKAVLCSYLLSLQKAPATKGRLTTPTAAHCNP